MRKILFAIIILFPAICFASEFDGVLSTGIETDIGGTVVVSPSASPSSGTYISSQTVVLTASGSSSIRYTLDNTEPSCSVGAIYSLPIPIAESKTIKAISCYSGANSSVATFSYTINSQKEFSPEELPKLLEENILVIPDGATPKETPSLEAKEDFSVVINDNDGQSTASVSLGTVIRRTDGKDFDATALTASAPAEGTLSNLVSGAVVKGALQWGISDLGLDFSEAVQLSIYVGASLNGTTLNVVRSVSGALWTSDGIVAPATCLVANGLCQFSATKASYYAVYLIPAPVQPPTSGGGVFNAIPAPVITKKGDFNTDNKVDQYDFASLMFNWGKTGSNPCDLNQDGTVNQYDFAILMFNWGK